jgi:hypothetical protein
VVALWPIDESGGAAVPSAAESVTDSGVGARALVVGKGGGGGLDCGGRRRVRDDSGCRGVGCSLRSRGGEALDKGEAKGDREEGKSRFDLVCGFRAVGCCCWRWGNEGARDACVDGRLDTVDVCGVVGATGNAEIEVEDV